jgi:hypothetical protein
MPVRFHRGSNDRRYRRFSLASPRPTLRLRRGSHSRSASNVAGASIVMGLADDGTSSSIGSTSHGGSPRSLDFATMRLASAAMGSVSSRNQRGYLNMRCYAVARGSHRADWCTCECSNPLPFAGLKKHSSNFSHK